MDDRRIGRALRALRRRRGLRQSDVAYAAGVGQSTVSRAELGHLDALSLRALRRIFGAVEASFEGDVRWRGGGLDRLLDERHAAVVGTVAQQLRAWSWRVVPEATFNHFGDRGSIDILAGHEAQRFVAVIEAKTEITSEEEMLRRLDTKARLAPVIATERFGWRPATVASFIVLPDKPRTGGVLPG